MFERFTDRARRAVQLAQEEGPMVGVVRPLGQQQHELGARTDGLWRRVLRRQGGQLAWLSTWTGDPDSN